MHCCRCLHGCPAEQLVTPTAGALRTTTASNGSWTWTSTNKVLTWALLCCCCYCQGPLGLVQTGHYGSVLQYCTAPPSCHPAPLLMASPSDGTASSCPIPQRCSPPGFSRHARQTQQADCTKRQKATKCRIAIDLPLTPLVVIILL